MADKTILELTDIGELNSGDQIPIARPGTTSDNKTSIQEINSYIKEGADNTPTSDSPNLITSGGVKTALNTKTDKGELHNIETTTLTVNPGESDRTYLCGTLTSLTINGTGTPKDSVLSIQFTSGSTATTINYNSSELKFTGGEIPVTETGKRYLLAVWMNTAVFTLLGDVN